MKKSVISAVIVFSILTGSVQTARAESLSPGAAGVGAVLGAAAGASMCFLVILAGTGGHGLNNKRVAYSLVPCVGFGAVMGASTALGRSQASTTHLNQSKILEVERENHTASTPQASAQAR